YKPRSTSSILFPYTTLFRSKSSELASIQSLDHKSSQSRISIGYLILATRAGFVFVLFERDLRSMRSASPAPVPIKLTGTPVSFRSEEHTSELQSRGHLVCRL